MKFHDDMDDSDLDGTRENVNRFRASLMLGRKRYFDVSEFEGIVDHLLEEGDLKTSELAVLQGMQIHPGAILLQMKYAQVLLNKGKFREALECILSIEKIEERNPDVFLIKGTALLMLEKEGKAARAFEKGIQLAGTEVDEVYFHIATSYVFAGKIDKAIEFFEKAVDANPENDYALGELGFFCEQLGDYEKSEKYYNKCIDLDPYNFYTWFNLGITLNLAEKYEKAISAYEYALLLNDKFHQALFNMSNSYANLGQYQKAISKYKEYLVFKPNNDDACSYIGECYLNLEEYSKAEKWYLKATKIEEFNDGAWFGLALLKWIDADFEAAILLVQKALKIDNTVCEYWLTLAKVYNEIFKYREAVKCIKKAAKLESENPEVWLTWVEIELRNGNVVEAFKTMASGLRKCGDVLLKYRMAGMLIDTKQTIEAKLILIIALEQDYNSHGYLFDCCPAAKKQKGIMKIIHGFKPDNR
jgi:tetratricopeptide (TPR) repeat protein